MGADEPVEAGLEEADERVATLDAPVLGAAIHRLLSRHEVKMSSGTRRDVATMHAMERTSPMGERFVGRCTLCGKEGLTTADMSRECVNPARISQDHALLDALEDHDE